MFGKLKKEKPIKKIFLTIIIGVAIVCFWRGTWGLLDVYLFPNNYMMSSWASFIISLVILKITHYLHKGLLD